MLKMVFQLVVVLGSIAVHRVVLAGLAWMYSFLTAQLALAADTISLRIEGQS